MLYVDAYGDLAITTDEKEKLLGDLVEELRLFKGENPTDIEKGLDYFAIFNGEKFLQVELEEVLERHRPYFNSIEAGDIEMNDVDETINVPITVTFKDGEQINTSLMINLNAGVVQ